MLMQMLPGTNAAVFYVRLTPYAQAKKGFGARTFDGKSVDATYYPEESFAAKAFSGN